jgi:DHA1 family multidrug resistance protein-like MFS transporter
MFNNKLRGQAIAVLSATVFIGPLLALFIGGFIMQSHLGWRWTGYISSLVGFLSIALLFFFIEETYPSCFLDCVGLNKPCLRDSLRLVLIHHDL